MLPWLPGAFENNFIASDSDKFVSYIGNEFSADDSFISSIRFLETFLFFDPIISLDGLRLSSSSKPSLKNSGVKIISSSGY